jgi:DNA polymerase
MNKIELLQRLSDKVSQCTKCSELVECRTKTVFSSGSPSKLMFIGEAPGENEDLQGEAFVGRAGELLTNILAAFGIDRNDVYICNILKCRPPNNRNPTPEEAKNCAPFLDLQIKIVNPKFIVCLGGIATNYLLGVNQYISHMRGRWFKYQKDHVDADVICTYHPSYLLRNENAKKDVADDMRMLLEKLTLRTSL